MAFVRCLLTTYMPRAHLIFQTPLYALYSAFMARDAIIDMLISVVVIFDALLTEHCAHKHDNVMLCFDLVRSFH